MNVLAVKPNNQITLRSIFTQTNNEVSSKDMTKWLSGSIDVVYATKISRLAYLYVMFIEKDAERRHVNKVASLLLNDGEGVIRGDAIIARADKFAASAKIFALKDDEAKEIAERISRLAKAKLGVTTSLSQ